jgi:SpoVK/Ycf46/Vps4 family AAA+-type ATPase
MAAETIANGAWQNAFNIELATVVNEYIGETEENLKAIFDEAEHTDAILVFDEADALFGERSEVSDSHDRYANVKVSYLQRMEEHVGAFVLASNLKENIKRSSDGST